MKRILNSLLLVILLAALLLTIAWKVPIPLATNSDFKVIYYTTQGLIRGIDVYDHTAKIEMINEVYGASIDETFIPQFAYPPWYALVVFYLGFFPIQKAAVLWFEINIIMLFVSIWFLTDGWKPFYRLMAFPVVFLFLPVAGTLAVGQYDLPVLLGTSMLMYSIKHRRIALTAFGMALLTFKPHLGGLILIAGLVHLFLRRDDFGKKSLAYTIFTGIFLFIIGFLADSSWFLDYLDSLINYRGLGHITTCSECVNISVWLSRTISGELSLSQAGTIAGLILTVLVVLLISIRPPLWKSPSLLLASVLMTTILASPYLYNYDFILLLVPFALLADSTIRRIAVITFCIGSTFALALYSRGGNNVLLIVSILTAVMLYYRIKSQVDVPAIASYNTSD